MKYSFVFYMPLMAQCLLCSCTGEKKQTRDLAFQRDLVEVTHKIELARYRMSKAATQSASKNNQDDLDSLEIRIKLQELKRQDLRESVMNLRENWDGFRRDILLSRRATIIGKTFENFHTSQGKHYKDILVSRIDDVGVSIRHSNGSARIRIDEMSPEVQHAFGLDMEFAAVAMSEERKSLAAYEIKIHRELTALKEAQKKKLDESKAERIRSDERLARALAIASISSAPVSQLRSSVSIGEISRRYPTYYPVYRKTRYRNVYYYGNYWNAAPRCNQLNFYKGVQQTPVKPISPPPPCGNHKH